MILRWEIPVDGEDHRIPAGIVHVAAREMATVEVWTKPSNDADIMVTVVGTGHTYPEEYRYLGTALAPEGLVWHLMKTGVVTWRP